MFFCEIAFLPSIFRIYYTPLLTLVSMKYIVILLFAHSSIEHLFATLLAVRVDFDETFSHSLLQDTLYQCVTHILIFDLKS